MVDYYSVLGVSKDATNEEIKKAYRKLVMEHHPDKGGDEVKFKAIAEAYEHIGNPESRKAYDNPPRQGFNHFDFFDQVFKNQRRQSAPAIKLVVNITIEDIFNSADKNIEFDRNMKCSGCDGQGGSIKTCTNCNGSGQIAHPMGNMMFAQTCDACQGEGIVIDKKCDTCIGSGITNKRENLTIKVPKGFTAGQTPLGFVGMGNAVRGGIYGNLIIEFFIEPHNDFVIHGYHLVYKVKLTYPQLVLGDKIIVPSIDGVKLKLTVPPLTKVNDQHKCTGKGLPNNFGDRGHMYVVYELEIPNEVTDEEKKLLLELRELSDKK